MAGGLLPVAAGHTRLRAAVRRPAGQAAHVVRVETHGTQLTLVGPEMGDVKIKSFMLRSPDRVILDFQDTVLTPRVSG